MKVVKALLLGKKPEIPTYPVCVECKRAGNVCVFELGHDLPGPGDPRRLRRLVSHATGITAWDAAGWFPTRTPTPRRKS